MIKPEPDVLFVGTNRNPGLFRNEPSFIYRCENLGLGLQSQGVSVGFRHLSGVTGRERCKVVVFLRPLATPRQWLLLRRLRRRGATLLADFDDLIFDESLARFSPGVLNGLRSPGWTKRRFRAHRRTLAWFDGITVSTPPLAEHVARLLPGQAVQILPNSVHRDWQQAAWTPPKERPRVLTYFPGTRSHDRDFAQISQPLTDFLVAHPQVRLRVAGSLHFKLDIDPDRIERQPRVHFSEYVKLVQQGWANLAPLEPTPFNQAKSALKVIEAACWGIPTVCSPNPDIRRFDGFGAVMADNDHQWRTQLERLVDPQSYRQLTENLREMVLERAGVDTQAKAFADAWLGGASS